MEDPGKSYYVILNYVVSIFFPAPALIQQVIYPYQMTTFESCPWAFRKPTWNHPSSWPLLPHDLVQQKHLNFPCSQSWTYQMVMQKKSWGLFVDFGIYLVAPVPTLFSSHAVWHMKKCLQKTWSTRFDWGLEHAYQEGSNCKPDFQDGGLCTSTFCGVFVAPKDV